MAKFLLINIGIHGHVNPTLGFTEELVKRGHDVLFLSTAEFEQKVKATGARFHAYNTCADTKSLAKSADMRDPAAQFERFGALLRDWKATLPGLTNIVEKERPDLIIYDFISIAGLMLTKRFDIPAVKFFTTYAFKKDFNLRDYTSSKRPDAQDSSSYYEHALKKLSEEDQEFGVNYQDAFNAPEETNLIFIPRSFHPASELFDERYKFVGPCMRSAEVNAVGVDIPEGNDPLILISMGTIFNDRPDFYRTCIELVRERPVRAVMAIGPIVDPASLGEIPTNMRITPHAQQIALLLQADLFVSHGGMNSTMESMAMGVPMVVIPQMEEQAASAMRIAELELGLHLPPEEMTKESLAAAIDEILNNSYFRGNAKKMSRDIQQAGGSKAAADAIEQTLKTKLEMGHADQWRVIELT